MPTTNEFHLFPLEKIFVSGSRQRKEIKGVEELASSIQRVGLLHPVVITRDGQLVAGERRFRALQFLKRELAPIHFVDELDENELKAIELEENVKRQDISWQETAEAIADYHDARLNQDGDWTLEKTADALGMESATISRYLTVWREMQVSPALREMGGIVAAYNSIQRRQRRAIDNEISKFLEVEQEVAAPSSHHSASNGAGPGVQSDDAPSGSPLPPPASHIPLDSIQIAQADFIKWVEEYRGPRFNFLHCDFPYGISMDSNELQGTRPDFARYADSKELYWQLCGALCEHMDKILSHSAHIMFWYSMTYHVETLAFFQARRPELSINPFPLIWHKSDGRGILPDPERGPRRTYETALMMTRGDRRIVSAVANSYSAPTNKSEALHLSEKPVPVLTHFFKMFVDDSTEMLDPTCGAGSSLCAAETYGAKRSLGVDIVPEFVETAKDRVLKMRANARLLEGLTA